MKLDPIITRLKTETNSFGTNVFGAGEFDDARRGSRQVEKPCAFVMRTTDVPTQVSIWSGPDPDIVEGFSIIAAIDNQTDQVGEEASNDVDTLRDELFVDIQDWVPVTDNMPSRYTGGALIGIIDNTLWYSYNFESLKPGAIVITYVLTVQVIVTPGTPSAAALNALNAKLAATFTTPGALQNKYKLGFDDLIQDKPYWGLIGAAQAMSRDDSNLAGFILPMELTVVKWLADGATENSYTNGEMTSNLDTLMDPDFWETPASVQEVTGPPNLSFPGDITRE